MDDGEIGRQLVISRVTAAEAYAVGLVATEPYVDVTS
jgi:hypothetical protein